MPMYECRELDAQGNPTGRMTEEIWKSTQFEGINEFGNPCKRVAIQMIADIKTRWGSSHAYYDRDLRMTVTCQKDIDKACEARGWLPVGDAPKGCIGATIDRQVAHYKNAEKVEEQWQAAEKKHGVDRTKDPTLPDQVQAWARAQAEVMPVHEMLAGTCAAAKTELTDF